MAESKCMVEYNWLGNSGIKVSNLCLGTMTMGDKYDKFFDLPRNTNDTQSFEILDKFVEYGGNFIDTANVYSDGNSERIIGSWMKNRQRSDFVLSTKVRFSFDLTKSKPYEDGLSRASILYHLDESLKRLGTDYIDLYYIHGYDTGVDIEESLRTFNDVVRSGKVRYMGLSNLYAWQIQKAVDYNKYMGFDKFAVLQQEYNLMTRCIETEVIPACQYSGIGILPYGSLKGGLLTGKFQRTEKDKSSLDGTRLGWVAEKPASRQFPDTPNVEKYRNDEAFWTLMDSVKKIADSHGKTISQVAIRWLLQKSVVSSVVIGAKSIKQLEDNMGAGTGWKLTDEEMQTLDDLSAAIISCKDNVLEVFKQFNVSRKRF